MHRPVGRFELAQILTDAAAPLNAVVVVRLTPGPERDALRRALDVLRRRHPFLGVHLVRNPGGYAFADAGTPEIPVVHLERLGDDHWLDVVEHELNTRFDVGTGPLLRLTCVEDDSGCDLVLTFQHAIMDATSAARLLHVLLEGCADPDVDVAPRTPVPPIEERFPAAFRGFGRAWRTAPFMARQLADEAVYRWRMRGARRPPIAAGAQNRVLTFELEPAATRALVRRSRRERVSLASVAGAAALLAVAARLYGGRRLPLRSLAFPNLRPHLRPKVDDEDLASCFVLMRLQTPVDPGGGLWPLARRLNAQTAAALGRGDKYLAAYLSPHLMRYLFAAASQRMAQTAVSYTGSPGLAPAYGDMRVLGLHAFVSDIPLGPEFTAQVRLAGGRLAWDVVYLDTDFDRAAAAALAADVRALLTAV